MTWTRLGCDARRRAAATRTRRGAARRMLALALVLDGRTRGEAAALCGMDRQTLRDWVRRYNVEGVAGLSDRPQLGRTPKLTAEQEAEIAELVRTGPDLTAHGVIRWRRKDLAQVIERRFGVALAERSVGAMLKRLGFRPLSSVRPRHPGHDAQADAQAQASFGQTSPPS
jgi:transposase